LICTATAKNANPFCSSLPGEEQGKGGNCTLPGCRHRQTQ
jgi:hypothetical protein